MPDLTPYKHLRDAALDIWPDVRWQTYPGGLPILYLNVKSKTDQKIRLIDCTNELDEDAVEFLRRTIFKAARNGIRSVVFTRKDSECDDAIYENIFADHPYFMAARFKGRGSKNAEIMETVDDWLKPKTVSRFLWLLRNDGFYFRGKSAYFGNRFAEYVQHICHECKDHIQALTGILITRKDAVEDILERGETVPHFGLDAIEGWLDDRVRWKLNQVEDFDGILKTPLADQAAADGEFICVCPHCQSPQNPAFLAQKVRLAYLLDQDEDRSARFRYIQIMKNWIMWDYFQLEAGKSDPDLYDSIGVRKPGWAVIDKYS